MKGEIVFLDKHHVLEIHRRMTEEFGGDAGIRDEGLLESAITMPRAQFQGDFLHCGLAEMAAAYLFHLCCNHPFVDGNKRTALASAEVFLFLNGAKLQATNREVTRLTMDVAGSQIGKNEVKGFFEKHVVM